MLWKMNFKSEVCSSSSFPAEAVVWLNEDDSARFIDELKSSIFFWGGIIPDFEVLDSKKCECSAEVADR